LRDKISLSFKIKISLKVMPVVWLTVAKVLEKNSASTFRFDPLLLIPQSFDWLAAFHLELL